MKISYISNRSIAFDFDGRQIIFSAENNNIQYFTEDSDDAKIMSSVMERMGSAFETIMMIVRRDTRSISLNHSSQNVVTICFNLFEPANAEILINLEYRKTVEGMAFCEVYAQTNVLNQDTPHIEHYVDVAKSLFTAVFEVETDFETTYRKVKNA